ncbi:MAG: hypothetical protein RH860_08915 [Cytophagales bacterium]
MQFFNSKISNGSFIWIITILIFLNACRTPPEYSNVPYIIFQDIERIEGSRFAITFYFEDGNADLGLNANGEDASPPFNASFYITAPINDPCNYKDTLTVPELNSEQALTDSIVKTYDNPTGRNVDLSLLVKNGEEYINRFYGISENCNINDTIYHPSIRFPRISETIIDEPVDGTVRFEIDLSFTPVLSTDTIVLEFFIYDRALNKSNTVRTDPVVKSP